MYKLYRVTPLRLFTLHLEGLSSTFCKRLQDQSSLTGETSPCAIRALQTTRPLEKSNRGAITEPITEVLTFSIHCSTSGQITLKADTSLTCVSIVAVQSEYNGESCYEIEHIGPLMSDLLR